MAFADREFQPSIDRSRVLVAQTFDAGYTQGVATNGVLRVKALAVRAEKIVHAERAYLADVHPDPCPPQAPTNHAHCLLKMSPAPDTKGTFRKLLERLSRMARWERLPKESIDRGDQIPPDTV